MGDGNGRTSRALVESGDRAEELHREAIEWLGQYTDGGLTSLGPG